MALEKSLIYVDHTQYILLCIAMPYNARLYRSLFTSHVEGQLLADIRVNSHKGMAIGNELFKQEIEALTSRKMKI